jgi:hypothetical protein
MKSSILLLAALASGVASGWAKTPAVAGPAAAGSATPLASSTATMSVLLNCSVHVGVGSKTINCWAYASGGSGSYDFTWWGVSEDLTMDWESRASAECPTSFPYTVEVDVMVTDDNSHFASAEKTVNCAVLEEVE